VKKKLIFLFLIIISSAILFYLRSEKVARLNVQLAGDSFFEGLKIINKKDGVTEWVLTAKRADLSKDGKEALLSGIEMKLEKQGMLVQAEKGLYNMETKNVAIDGVITARNENYVITTSQALIDSGGGILETEGEVTVEGKRFNLEGKGLQADNNEQKVRILNNVKATFHRKYLFSYLFSLGNSRRAQGKNKRAHNRHV
jgi:LPS export ABC transporter protein LptC